MNRTPKSKPCAAPKCRKTFTPRNGLQRACSQPCALAWARERAEKKERRARRLDTRAAREALKTKPQLTKEAQASFNAFIRLRDAGLPCISCGQHPKSTHLTGGGMDCGHYRSVGANPELRFEERNAHGQCKHCNKHLSGNVVNYRIGLINRLGVAEVHWLECAHVMPNWTRDQLREIRDKYRAKANELRRERAAKQAA